MHDLTAQVTSSLLPFSGVTVDALGEDEISLDCVLHGRFTVGRVGLAWLASGPNLEVVHAVTGERLSAYCFSGGGEHPPVVLAARDFSWLKRSGLLVGLEETEGSVLCLYDLGLSRVVKAVVIPGRITAIEPLVSYGGASTSTQHLHQSLRWFFGIAAVVTDLGHVLLVDLCLDDLSCSQSELEASDLQVVTKSPADIPGLREDSTKQGRHLCLQLNSPGGVGVTALQYISRSNQLAVGFSDGHLQLWNMKTLKKEYHSQLEGGRVPVHAFTFQEPENDPRNCCYLWAVQSSQDLEGDLVSLHLLQLAFSERKCLASGKILYEGLEYCEERYSQDLSGPVLPLRAQASNTRLLRCQTIEKFRAHPDRDNSMNEVASPDTSLSIFSWQVKAYGQGSPSTYIGVFDINRWYHAQMPDSLRSGESLQNCPYLAVWSLDAVAQMVSPHSFLDVVVHERSLSRGLPFTCPPPEQYFNPTTYNFDATCLLNSGIVHLTCSGHQKETLSFLKKAAPCSSDIISLSYSHCLMSGLLSSRVADTHASNLSQEEQLDAILSTAVENSSLGLITGCIKQWTAEEQPGSALNLRYMLDWAWNKVVHTKEELDVICAPLFDSSSNFTDPQTLQLLQHTSRLLSNLSAIFHCLLSEAQELTQQGLAGLINKNMVSSLISKYAQVVLWFCRTGLLPEGSDEDALHIPRPFFTHSMISNYYAIRREELTRLAKTKWCADCLMIDGLVGQCGERLTNLWKRDEGGTGLYPPPTLHALLDIYLLDNIDEAAKHAILIYLLLDVMYSFPNKDGTSVESFPTAFAIPMGLVKLVQGLWLLDHHDHQSSFDLLLHPAASRFHFAWQHERVLQALMCQGQHSVALRYFHVTKPAIASTAQAKLCLTVLLHNRCLIEAWCLLRMHSNLLNIAELLRFLYESCQEQGLIKELLKLPLGPNEQDGLEKFLQGTGGLQNRELLMIHYLQQANYIPALQLNQTLKMNLVSERDPKLKERSNTRNSILEQYGKVLPRVQRKLAVERAKPYQHHFTIHKEVSRPQPLSAISKPSANEKVMSRAGFINSVLSKIEEARLGKEATPQSSAAKTPKASAIQSSSPRPSALGFTDPFLGTPITMTTKQKSRLMDLVVHPSCWTPQPLLSSPRPLSSWVSPKSIRKAPELSLLQTPQVVKRARALAASGPVFSTFTPQSILRSSLRATPVATPSASPGRSITPPLRSKESRITFIEEAQTLETDKGTRRTNGMAAESEISQLSRGPKATYKTWSVPVEEEEQGQHPRVKFLPPAQLRRSESERSSPQEEAAETSPSAASQINVSLNFDTSQTAVRSTDTTLEFYDAPLSENPEGVQGQTLGDYEEDDDDDDDDVVTLNIKPATEKEAEQTADMTTEQSFTLASEDELKVEKPLQQEGAGEEVADQNVHEGAGVDKSKRDKEEYLKTTLISKYIANPVPEEPPAHHQVCNNQVSDGSEVRSEEQQEGNKELHVLQEEHQELHVLQEGNQELHVLHEGNQELHALQEEHQELHVLQEGNQELHVLHEGNQELHVLHEGNQELHVLQEGNHELHVLQEGNQELHVQQEENLELHVQKGEHQELYVQQEEHLELYVQKGEHQELHVQQEEHQELHVQQEEHQELHLQQEEHQELHVQQEAAVLNTERPDTAAADPEQTTDLTEFVQQQLFGDDLSPLLGRSAIHNASLSQTSLNSELLGEEEEEKLPAGDPWVFTTQKSTVSLTSSEPTGTDSHSVLSVNDSEELSSPASEDEGEEDEEESSNQAEEEDEVEDSGSEVEIIKEVEGNGRLPALQPSSAFVQQEHGHFLRELSEPQPGDFCQIAPDAEVKMAEEDVEGEVVMVSLGRDDGGMDLKSNAEQGSSSYMEFKPSTTLLVPFEFMEGQPGLMDSAHLTLPELQSSVVAEDQQPEIHTGFTLMLDTDEDAVKVAPVVGREPQTAELPEQLQKQSDDFSDKPPVVPSDTDNVENVLQEEEEITETENSHETDVDGLKEEPGDVRADLQAEFTTAKEKMDDSAEQNHSNSENGRLAEDNKATSLLISQEPPAAVKEEELLPEGNGPVDTEMEAPASAVEEEKHESLTSEEEPRRHENVKEELIEEAVASDSRTTKQTPTSQGKNTSSTPTRKMTRGRNVTFISPPLESADEPELDANTDLTKNINAAPASPTRTPRKTKPPQTVTPRRSTRKSQPELPKQDGGDMDSEVSVASTSKTSSPGRRLHRSTAARTSQVEMKEESQEDEDEETTGGRRTSAKEPTPSKHTTTQANTPRRSSRKTGKANEEKDQAVPPMKRSSRKMRPEVLPAVLEEEDEKRPQLSSPGRRTRQSSRVALNSNRKKREETSSGKVKESRDLLESDPNENAARPSSRRPTRSRLWDHPVEDLPLLDSPLEVDSETPVADALIKRLKDEEEKREGGILTKRKQICSPPPAPDTLEDESGPDEPSFIYSPSRRRQTRAHKAESPPQSEESGAPVTRSRTRVCSAQDKVSSEEDQAKVEKTPQSRKTTKKTAKSRAGSESVPIAQVDLVSPLPSPTDMLPLAPKRVTDGEVPTATRNLRRKRILNPVYSKPVTRRRKL